MNTLDSPRVRLQTITEQDRLLIRSALDELTKNVHFSGSKRYPALLRYVVEKALAGKADELKERTLGVEVFHRPPDYDTNNDTVVRVTAGEVRKRLALTYHESGELHPVQISLPAGSYIPEFYRQPSTEENGDPAAAVTETSPVLGAVPATFVAAPVTPEPPPPRDTPFAQPSLSPPPKPSSRRIGRTASLMAVIALGGALVGGLLTAYRPDLSKSPVDRFWLPLRTNGVPVLFCAGALIPTTSESSGFTEANKSDDYPYISMATADALAAVGHQLTRDHIEFFMQPSSSTSLTDMRVHPTVLFGAYDNKWSILVSKDLRYRFTDKPVMEIYDEKVPSRVWRRVDALPYKDKDDYAIVARFNDKVTDNLIVVIAGLGKNGTEAAAQFVTTPRYLELLGGKSISDLGSKNIEIVLKTTVVDSKTGPPSIEAVEIW